MSVIHRVLVLKTMSGLGGGGGGGGILEGKILKFTFWKSHLIVTKI